MTLSQNTFSPQNSLICFSVDGWSNGWSVSLEHVRVGRLVPVPLDVMVGLQLHLRAES